MDQFEFISRMVNSYLTIKELILYRQVSHFFHDNSDDPKKRLNDQVRKNIDQFRIYLLSEKVMNLQISTQMILDDLPFIEPMFHNKNRIIARAWLHLLNECNHSSNGNFCSICIIAKQQLYSHYVQKRKAFVCIEMEGSFILSCAMTLYH